MYPIWVYIQLKVLKVLFQLIFYKFYINQLTVMTKNKIEVRWIMYELYEIFKYDVLSGMSIMGVFRPRLWTRTYEASSSTNNRIILSGESNLSYWQCPVLFHLAESGDGEVLLVVRLIAGYVIVDGVKFTAYSPAIGRCCSMFTCSMFTGLTGMRKGGDGELGGSSGVCGWKRVYVCMSLSYGDCLGCVKNSIYFNQWRWSA